MPNALKNISEKYSGEEYPKFSEISFIDIADSFNKNFAFVSLIEFIYLIGVVCMIFAKLCINEDLDMWHIFAYSSILKVF